MRGLVESKLGVVQNAPALSGLVSAMEESLVDDVDSNPMLDRNDEKSLKSVGKEGVATETSDSSTSVPNDGTYLKIDGVGLIKPYGYSVSCNLKQFSRVSIKGDVCFVSEL